MGLSLYMGIAILLLLGALGGSGILLKNSYEANGALQTAAEVNIAEVAEAKLEIERMLRKRDELQRNILDLGSDNSALEQELAASVARYDRFRKTLNRRTLKKPKVTERAARMDIGRRQCALWKVTGGQGKCPR